MAKILLLTHIYPPAVDGGSKVISKINQYLTDIGYSTLVVTSNCTLTDDFSKLNHPTLNHPKNIISLPVLTIFHRPLKFLAKIFPSLKTFSLGPIFAYLPIIKVINFHPDFIFAGPLPTTIIIYARIFQVLTGAKLIINPCFHPKDPAFNTPVLLNVLNKSDFIWCLTDYEKNFLKNTLNIKSPTYFVHGLGVDPDFIINKDKINFPKNPHIIFIANFSTHKRAELLIESFNQILKKYPLAKLTLLGQKTLYFPNIISFIEKLPLKTKSRIKFIFKPDISQIKSSIDTCSCLVLPSVQESFGLVFVESLARGKPVIGANTPQTSEVLSKLNGGLVFKCDDVNDLSLNILKLIESPSLSKKLGGCGYQNVKKFYTWNKIGEELCKKLSI